MHTSCNSDTNCFDRFPGQSDAPLAPRNAAGTSADAIGPARIVGVGRADSHTSRFDSHDRSSLEIVAVANENVDSHGALLLGTQRHESHDPLVRLTIAISPKSLSRVMST